MIVYVPQDIMDRLFGQLKSVPKEIPEALRNTINDTAKSARREIVTQAQKQYSVKAGAFNKSMQIENATKKHLQATLHSEGKPMPLYGFKKRKNIGPVAAKAQVLSRGSLKELTLKGGDDNGKDLKAFVQKMKKNGHLGIFERMTREERRKSISQKRSPIKQLYAPSIPQMLGNEKDVYAVVQPVIVKELRKNLEKHIAAVME